MQQPNSIIRIVVNIIAGYSIGKLSGKNVAYIAVCSIRGCRVVYN